MNESGSRRIGVVVAMDEEMRHLFDLATDATPRPATARPVYDVVFGKQSAVVTRCGIGLVNAAATTEWLINQEQLDIILNFGCAGAHRRDLMPGDLVIGDRLIQHSALHILPDGTEHYKGFHTIVEGQPAHAPEIVADPALVALARRLAETKPPSPWPAALFWPDGQPHRHPVVVTGPVASADVWTQSIPRLDLLHQRHQSLCEDMEAAAIAQVAHLHGKPFLAVKDISNNEFHRPSDLSAFSDFPYNEVGKRAAALVAELVAALDPNP